MPLKGGPARIWSSAEELGAAGFLGANGIKVHDGAVWATNLDQGTLLRIPIRHGRAAPVKVEATGLAGIDDIAFTGDDQVIATLNAPNKVVRIDGRGHARPCSPRASRTPPRWPSAAGPSTSSAPPTSPAADPNLILAPLI